MDVQKIFGAMLGLYCGDVRRIQHFTKVWAYASFIGKKEGLDPKTQNILEAAALVHDIGIHKCEEKYGECGGKLQEKEGPPIAEKLLSDIGIERGIIDRVCFLVAHHHTYRADSIDWQILLEADFLVNAYEDNLLKDAVYNGYKNIFRTDAGKEILRKMFDLEE